MIRIEYFPTGYNIDPWPNNTDEDETMKLWVVNQLMGETTEKDDTFMLAHVTGPDNTFSDPDRHKIELWTGIIADKNMRTKALIPALFTVKHEGIFTEYDYTGLVGETEDNIEASYREARRDGSIDEAVLKWFIIPELQRHIEKKYS